MKYWVLGCGRIGIAAIYYLLLDEQTTAITITDSSVATLRAAPEKFLRAGIPQARIDQLCTFLPITDTDGLAERLEAGSVILCCLPYTLNPAVAKIAVQTGCHYADLGGNNDATGEVLALHKAAKDNGVTLIPDCGLAPGLAGILAMHGMPRFDRVDNIKLRCGGLPQNPEGPFQYSLVFSPNGLINEYVEPALAIRNGEVKLLPSMIDCEEIDFAPPWGHLEAFTTSGGTSTLPVTLKGKVRELDYKTVRYPGHCDKVRTLLDCGLADQNLWQLPNSTVKPRELLEEVFRRTCPPDQPDVVLLRAELSGEKNGKPKKVVFELIDTYDRRTGLSAMQRTTGFPLAIAGRFLADGTIATRGAVHQEVAIPSGLYLKELGRVGIRVTGGEPGSEEESVND